MTGRGGSLAGVRRVDWRFLLPSEAMGSVATIGPVDDDLRTALGAVAGRLVADGHGEPLSATPDLVVTVAPTAPALGQAIALVPPGGWIYVGAGPRSAGARQSLRQVAARLRADGFEGVRRSWHWPSEPAALEIVPIDDARAVRYALARRRNDRLARLKAKAAAVALRVGWLDRIVPGWSVIGRRPGAAGSVDRAGSDDAVRRCLPDDLANAPIVLFTPRFRSSRHVIGIALDPTRGNPAAVAKLPRLVADDGGIQREATALRQAADLGIEGVPRVISIGGSPRPALVESPLDGRIVSRHDVRSRAVELIDEVEAWSRRLTGGPDRRSAPLRARWEPAVMRIESSLATLSTHPRPAPAVPPELAELVDLVERTRRSIEPFDAVSVPIVLEHGDLAPPNLLRLRDGQLGVVDWEVADLDGLALGDLLFFAAFVGSVTAAEAVDGSAADPARPTIPGIARPAVERQAAVLGLDPGLIAVLDVVMWARWADRQLTRFADPEDATPIGERLPRRHIRSWSAAVAHLEDHVREADSGHPRYDARPQPPDR